MRCYLPMDISGRKAEERLVRVGFTPAPGAGRIVFMAAGQHLIEQSSFVGGYHVASPIRVYVDLLREVARGEEAAMHLRNIAIGF